MPDEVNEFLEAPYRVSDSDEEIAARFKRRRLRFTGTIDAEPDLSARTDEYLQGFGEDDHE